MQDVRNYGLSNGKPAIALFVLKEPGANIIETVQRVRELLPRLQASIPQAIDLKVISDRTPTIRASLREVERAMSIAVGLVILVVLLFLRSWRATLLPAVAVPVSLAGTFGVMYLCGYSLDNLSAMALTVATGFVVDDAIVVLENITRYIEQGLSPREAALQGRARDRLHRGVDLAQPGRGVHPAAGDGRRRRAAVPRVRGGAVVGHPGVDGGVADDHADDGRDPAAASRGASARPAAPRAALAVRPRRRCSAATAAR